MGPALRKTFLLLPQRKTEQLHASPRKRTRKGVHNLNAFEGGGPVKCWHAFICLTVFFARFHFSRSPHFLRDFIYFL